MGILSPNLERKTQLFFRDDNKFQFIPRVLENTCLVEKDNDQIKKAWKHFYGTELPFRGYKGIKASMVTLGFARDIILDPFNRVPEGTEPGQKPKKSATTIKEWISKIAESQRQIRRNKRETHYLTNKIIWAEIAIVVILATVWAVRFLT